MKRDINPTDAREGENRKWQWRTFVISTVLAAIVMFTLYFTVIANNPG